MSSSSYFKLSPILRKRLQQELKPGERIVWAGTPDWTANWRSLAITAAFALGWTTISGFAALMLAAATFGFAPLGRNGADGSRWFTGGFLAFVLIFVAIGIALLLHVVRELRSGSRRVHAVTDRRIMSVEIGSKTPLVDRDRQSIKFVQARERRDGSGTLTIVCNAVGIPQSGNDADPETIIWPGIPDVAFVRSTLDRQSSPAATATSRAAEQTVFPSALSSLPKALARSADRETRGERIAWVGQSDAGRIARWSMLIWIIALPWLWFTVRWELTSIDLLMKELSSSTSRTPIVFLAVFALWGLPFIAIGLGMLSAPLWIYRRTRQTAHIITDRRILTVQRRRNDIHVASIEPKRIVSTTRRDHGNGRGSIRIVLGKTLDSDGDPTELAETLWLVKDAARADALIAELRNDGRKEAR